MQDGIVCLKNFEKEDQKAYMESKGLGLVKKKHWWKVSISWFVKGCRGIDFLYVYHVEILDRRGVV